MRWSHADRQRLPETCSGEVNSRQSQVIQLLLMEQTMFGTDDIFFRSVNPDHITVSKTATQPVCNTRQSAMEPLQLKIRSSMLCLSRSWSPVLRRLLHRSKPAADLWLLSLALHGVHMHHHVSWGVTRCLLHQGLLRFRARHNPAVSLW